MTTRRSRQAAPAAAPPDPFAGVDPEATYRVDLKRPVQFGRTWLRPGAGVTLKGKVLLAHKDSVDGFRPIAD